ncbi:hypothetical protein FOA52_015068 [Chlamydomonas sp. UWO 241]|nr:hypothetical protein FOA52_015068 [Chlamydomonas sp. UWO 241]
MRGARATLAATLVLLLAVALTQECSGQVVPASASVTLYYSTEANRACLQDANCGETQDGISRFCSKPLANAAGTCLQCWRCHLFPDVYGVCPSAVCPRAYWEPCFLAAHCGQGLFCAANASCATCRACVADVDEVSGNCSRSCPSGALGAPPGGLLAQRRFNTEDYLFLAFSIAEVSPGSSPAVTGSVRASDLREWTGLAGGQANFTLTALGLALPITPSSTLPVPELVAELLDTPSQAIVCPRLSGPLAATVFTGCPCNATSGASTFACPAGDRCSRAAVHGLPAVETARQPALGLLRAVCVACAVGQYCPRGTYLANETDQSSLECAAGSYCPSPDGQLDCPAGSYCVTGSSAPTTCDFAGLLEDQPYLVMPTQGKRVVDRIRTDRDPLRGNTCPVGATRPNMLCPAGRYCPEASESLLCPASYFCKEQSTKPRKCGSLTACPEGSSSPTFLGEALVIALGIAASLPLIWFAIRWADQSAATAVDNGNAAEAMEQLRLRVAKWMPLVLSDSASSATWQSVKKSGNGEHTHTSTRTEWAGAPGGAAAAAAAAAAAGDAAGGGVANGVVGKGVAGNGVAAVQGRYKGFQRVEPSLGLEFVNLGMRLKKDDTVVLQGVSGFFPAGKLSAVMGPSGSGKTTFLNVLCGNVSRDSVINGQVRVNGTPVLLSRLTNITGFVPQDDIVHADLTVRENLAYAAALKLPQREYPRSARRRVVNECLTMLQLEHICHYLVGTVERRGISGGQRKRVNIGLEVVGQPSLLFLDEPTSGLDSTVSSDILRSLDDMAQSLGMTVVAVIHQPRYSSFNLFDEVLLLGQGGRTVYMGPPGIAVLYFQHGLRFTLPRNENPADVLMDIVGGKVLRTGDPDFRPSDLVEWWRDKGTQWVSAFERANPLMKQENLVLDPESLQDIDDAFDIVDENGIGTIDLEQIMDLFDLLGMPLTREDAALLIDKIDPGTNADGDDTPNQDGADGAGGSRAEGVSGSIGAVRGDRGGDLSGPAGARRPAATTRTSAALDAMGSEQLPQAELRAVAARQQRPASAAAAVGSRDVPAPAAPPRGPVISKQQLMGALLATFDKKVAESRVHPMDRFADPAAEQFYTLPDIDVAPRTPSHGASPWCVPSRAAAALGDGLGLDSLGGWPMCEAREGEGDAVTPFYSAGASFGAAAAASSEGGAPQRQRSAVATRDLSGLLRTGVSSAGPSSHSDRHSRVAGAGPSSLSDMHSGGGAQRTSGSGGALLHGGVSYVSEFGDEPSDWPLVFDSAGEEEEVAGGERSFPQHVTAPAGLAAAAGGGRGGGGGGGSSTRYRSLNFDAAVSLLSDGVHSGPLPLATRHVALAGRAQALPASPFAAAALLPHGHTRHASMPAVPVAQQQQYQRSPLALRLRNAAAAKSDSRQGGGLPLARPGAGGVAGGGRSSTMSGDAQQPRTLLTQGTLRAERILAQALHQSMTSMRAGTGAHPSFMLLRGGGGDGSGWSTGTEGGASGPSDNQPLSPGAGVAGRGSAWGGGVGDHNNVHLGLAERGTPPRWFQLAVLLRRGMTKYLRAFWPLRVIDTLLLLCAAVIVGVRGWVFLSPALFLGPYYMLTLPQLAFWQYYLAAVCVCWWASGMAYLVSSVVPGPSVLMVGVFIALIMGAFVQGLSPTIASVRGGALEVLFGLSYNRWAMEVVSTRELLLYTNSSQNVVVGIFHDIGLCGLDTALVDDGNTEGRALTPREAISFLHVSAEFSATSCDGYVDAGQWVLFALGAAFRVFAFLALKFLSL